MKEIQEPEKETQEPERRSAAGEELRFVAVSNRLPVVAQKVDGEWTTRPGSGGLVTALAPVLRDRGGVWVGWPGTEEPVDLAPLLDEASRQTGYRLHQVSLSEEEFEGYYLGFSNSVLWPLFHDLIDRCDFEPEFWDRYRTVNQRFARTLAEKTREDDYLWVHDYHLIGVAHELRKLQVARRCGFFLHIPFPPLEIFLKLPWRSQILESLLEYDLLGFQTLRDRTHFLECARALRPDVQTGGKGSVVTARTREREVRVGSFPISIDFKEFAQGAAKPAVASQARELRRSMGARKLVLGVDRLDYTKGIPERLRAVRRALRRFPELRGELCLVQVVVPSRQDVPEYRSLRAEIDRLVGEINGEFTAKGWVPIHYRYQSLDRDELLAHYRAADIALVTPLRDGMNLVAKEYCASCVGEPGTLILSEFAGAAAQLHRWALMVNPHDVDGVAEAIRYAVHMEPEERERRMRGLRESVRRNDIYRWVDQFLDAAVAKQLEDFPRVEDYMPPLDARRDRPMPDAAPERRGPERPANAREASAVPAASAPAALH